MKIGEGLALTWWWATRGPLLLVVGLLVIVTSPFWGIGILIGKVEDYVKEVMDERSRRHYENYKKKKALSDTTCYCGSLWQVICVLGSAWL